MNDRAMAQAVYSWATMTFSGGRGYGMVGYSQNWTTLDCTPPDALQFVNRPVDIAGESSWVDPQTAFEFHPDFAWGPLVVLKRDLGLDPGGRAGRLVVCSLIDPTKTLSTAQALIIGHQLLPGLDWSVDAEPTRDLAPIPIPRAVSDARPSTQLCAAIIHCARTGVPVQVAVGPDELLNLAASFAALPQQLVTRITLSSSRTESAHQLVLGAANDAIDPGTVQLAEEYLTHRQVFGQPAATSWDHLDQWLEDCTRRGRPVRELSINELGAEIRTQVDDNRITECLAELARRESIGEVAARTRDSQLTDVPDRIRHRYREVLLDRLYSRPLQSKRPLATARAIRANREELAQLAERIAESYLAHESTTANQRAGLVEQFDELGSLVQSATFDRLLADAAFMYKTCGGWGRVAERITAQVHTRRTSPAINAAFVTLAQQQPAKVAAWLTAPASAIPNLQPELITRDQVEDPRPPAMLHPPMTDLAREERASSRRDAIDRTSAMLRQSRRRWLIGAFLIVIVHICLVFVVPADRLAWIRASADGSIVLALVVVDLIQADRLRRR